MVLQKGETKRDKLLYYYWRYGDDGEMHLYEPGDLVGYGRAKELAQRGARAEEEFSRASNALRDAATVPTGMAEKMEESMTRSEIGTYLNDFADDVALDGAARVDLEDDVVSVNPPQDIDFEVSIDDSSSAGGGQQRRLMFELTWEKSEYDEELDH